MIPISLLVLAAAVLLWVTFGVPSSATDRSRVHTRIAGSEKERYVDRVVRDQIPRTEPSECESRHDAGADAIARCGLEAREGQAGQTEAAPKAQPVSFRAFHADGAEVEIGRLVVAKAGMALKLEGGASPGLGVLAEVEPGVYATHLQSHPLTQWSKVVVDEATRNIELQLAHHQTLTVRLPEEFAWISVEAYSREAELAEYPVELRQGEGGDWCARLPAGRYGVTAVARHFVDGRAVGLAAFRECEISCGDAQLELVGVLERTGSIAIQVEPEPKAFCLVSEDRKQVILHRPNRGPIDLVVPVGKYRVLLEGEDAMQVRVVPSPGASS